MLLAYSHEALFISHYSRQAMFVRPLFIENTIHPATLFIDDTNNTHNINAIHANIIHYSY